MRLLRGGTRTIQSLGPTPKRCDVPQHEHVLFICMCVEDAIRRGAAENEVQKHEEKLTGDWRQISTLRRRYEKWYKGDDIEDCAHKQRYEESYQSMVKVLQQNTWIDDRFF